MTFSARFRNFIVSVLYGVSNFFLEAFRRLLFGRKFPEAPRTVLVYRIGHLGDTWCAVPAIAAVRRRFSGSRLILLTNAPYGNLPSSAEALKPFVEFQDVISYNPARLSDRGYVRSLRDRLKRERIDLLVYLGVSIAPPGRLLRDMLFFKAAGCRAAAGFKVDTLRIFGLGQRKFRSFEKEPQRLINLLKPLKISGQISWPVPRVKFDGLPLDSNVPLIALHPSAKFPAKKWPAERFAEVARRLRSRHQASFVIVGGSDAKPEAEFLAGALSGKVLDLTGKTGFLETAEVLRRCVFLLSNDSGPVHLAASVGTPVVGIYSARDFTDSWYPWGSGHTILRKDVDCQICYLQTCPVMTCLKNISVDEVLAACEEILSRSRKNPAAVSKS